MIYRRPLLAALGLLLMAAVAEAQPLAVTDISPAPGILTSSGPATVAITFSADVDPATVSGTTFTLVRAGPDTILNTGDDVTITPVSISATGAVVTLDLTGVTWPVDTYAIKISGRSVAPSPHAGLFGHWALDEGTGTTVADVSGHDRHGTLNGPTWSPGLFGNALVFGSGAPRVDIDAGLLFGESTAALWVHRSGDVAGTAATLMDRQASATHTSLRLEQAVGNDVGITEYTIVDYGTGYVAPIGSWIHLAFVLNSAALRFYVNGVLVHTLAQEWYLSVDKLGSALATRSHSLLGLMDEVQVYDRVLTDAEIASLAVISGCVRGTGGRILDGDFAGTLPSGDGIEGGDFLSTFTVDPTPIPPDPPVSPAEEGGGGSKGCGAVGVEGPLAWAALLLFRRRRHRRLV